MAGHTANIPHFIIFKAQYLLNHVQEANDVYTVAVYKRFWPNHKMSPYQSIFTEYLFLKLALD